MLHQPWKRTPPASDSLVRLRESLTTRAEAMEPQAWAVLLPRDLIKGDWETGQQKSSRWRTGEERGGEERGLFHLDMLRSGRILRPIKDRLDGLEGVEV